MNSIAIDNLHQKILKWATTEVIEFTSPAEEEYYQLLEFCATDLNSSKIREIVTLLVVGLKPSTGKLGYDSDEFAIEVKPKLYTGKHRLNGAGNYSDLTQARHDMYINDNTTLLYSGWSATGKIIFVVSFMYITLAKRMQYLINKHRSVRTAGFSLLDWRDDFKLLYLSKNFTSYANIMAPKLYKTLSNAKYTGSDVDTTQIKYHNDFFQF